MEQPKVNPFYTSPTPTYKSSTTTTYTYPNDNETKRLEDASLQLLAALIASGEGRGLMTDLTGDYRKGLADLAVGLAQAVFDNITERQG